MAEFDESKVINPLHKDKAEVGKKYYFADYFGILKERVDSDDCPFVEVLTYISNEDNCCFSVAGSMYALLYPYEEPPKKIMTERMYAEWLSKGFGECTVTGDKDDGYSFMHHAYRKEDENEPLPEYVRIRRWGETEWVIPTVDIYEKDCKGV